MFNVGDIITGLPNNNYGVTTSNATMQVIERRSASKIGVRILSHSGGGMMDFVGEDFMDLDSIKFRLVYSSTIVNVTLDKNFNIISEGLTDDEQKDFYIALQEWKPECEGTSTEPRVQEIEARGQSVSTTSNPHHNQLGISSLARVLAARDEWAAFIEGAEHAPISEHSREQAGDISYALPIAGHQHTAVDSVQTGSVNMDRAGEQGRSAHITQRAQRERDRNDNIDRFLRAGYRPFIR